MVVVKEQSAVSIPRLNDEWRARFSQGTMRRAPEGPGPRRLTLNVWRTISGYTHIHLSYICGRTPILEVPTVGVPTDGLDLCAFSKSSRTLPYTSTCAVVRGQSRVTCVGQKYIIPSPVAYSKDIIRVDFIPWRMTDGVRY